MKKYCVFDADGVLIDSLNIACKVFNEIADKHFDFLPRISNQDDMVFVYPGPLKTSLRRFGMSDSNIERFFLLHSSGMFNNRENIIPFLDVINCVSSLLSGECSIITSSHGNTVIDSMSKAGFSAGKIFNHIVGREENKLKTQRILNLVRKVGIEKSRVIYVGDMVSDIIYCREISISVATVGYGYHPSNYLSVFDGVVV